ncbi:hypothetical protein EBS43_03485 [bacterium]|nr:hypothetical protein [bacterium]
MSPFKSKCTTKPNAQDHDLSVRRTPSSQDLKLGEDYYLDLNGNLVFTEFYHLKRGYCCKNGCLHCPYQASSK